MSDFTNRTEDAVRELCVRTDLAVRSAAARLREQRGQTAAEYMGLLLIVALIIGVLFASEIGDWIVKRRRAEHRQDQGGRPDGRLSAAALDLSPGATAPERA